MSAPLTDAELVAEVKRCPDTVRELLLATRLAVALERLEELTALHLSRPSAQAWNVFLARAAGHECALYRSGPEDGVVRFFVVNRESVWMLPDVAALEQLLDGADQSKALRAGADHVHAGREA